MSVLEKLMEVAKADTDALYNLQEQGDDFTLPRDVEFILIASDKDKAEAVTGYINDYRYGTADIIEGENEIKVVVVIRTPIDQQVILSISGFIACLCELFSLNYDGWGCLVQRKQGGS